jgi:serine/threonine-protein kinase
VKANGRVKMVDFGVARHFQPKSTATMIGTQGYAPPEQYFEKVEVRSDLYALGATLHYLLTGRDPAAAPPFQLSGDAQISTHDQSRPRESRRSVACL